MTDETIHYERAITFHSGAMCDVKGRYDLTEEVHKCTCSKCLVAAMEVANGIIQECKAQLSKLGCLHLIEDVANANEDGYVDQRRRKR